MARSVMEIKRDWQQGPLVSEREMLQQAATVFRDQYPGLSAESVIAFILISDHGEPTITDISTAIGLPDQQVFEHVAPLRAAGLITVEAAEGGTTKILLTATGQQTKDMLMGL